MSRWARWIGVVALSAVLGGCVSTTGRRIPLKQLDGFATFVTSTATVVDVLGRPEAVTENEADHMTIFSYEWIVQTIVGVGLPPWFIIGRIGKSGYHVDIAFFNGAFAGYTRSTFRQRLFRRGREASHASR